MSDEKDALERTQELFDFLQGHTPEGYSVGEDHMPKLTPDQAFAVIWYLGNQYWQVTDHVERCGVCGGLYDTNNSGHCLDYGKAPYHFCDDCMRSEEYATKAKVNPDKNARP